MKIYKHSGMGHYLGSCVVVVANSQDEARVMVRSVLDAHGLRREVVVSLEEFDVTPGYIHIDDGDY